MEHLSWLRCSTPVSEAASDSTMERNIWRADERRLRSRRDCEPASTKNTFSLESPESRPANAHPLAPASAIMMSHSPTIPAPPVLPILYQPPGTLPNVQLLTRIRHCYDRRLRPFSSSVSREWRLWNGFSKDQQVGGVAGDVEGKGVDRRFGRTTYDLLARYCPLLDDSDCPAALSQTGPRCIRLSGNHSSGRPPRDSSGNQPSPATSPRTRRG